MAEPSSSGNITGTMLRTVRSDGGKVVEANKEPFIFKSVWCRTGYVPNVITKSIVLYNLHLSHCILQAG